MLKKSLLGLLAAVFLAMLVSCGRTAEPEYESADMLANKLYTEANLNHDGVYAEYLDSSSAYIFGLSIADFNETVKNAVVYRKSLDSDGQTLYALEMSTQDAAALLAEDYYNHYEWAACDNSEKLVVACAGRYVLLFKSNAAEADAALEGFRKLSGGRLLYQRELINKG